MKLVSRGDVKSLSAKITINAKEVHPYLVGGEGSQLMVVVVDHGYSDHQTSKGNTNKKNYDTIVPMYQLHVQQCMHFSQLHIVTQLARVFT